MDSPSTTVARSPLEFSSVYSGYHFEEERQSSPVKQVHVFHSVSDAGFEGAHVVSAFRLGASYALCRFAAKLQCTEGSFWRRHEPAEALVKNSLDVARVDVRMAANHPGFFAD